MIERKKIGTVAFWVLLGFYLIDVILPIVGSTWFSRSVVHLFWSGFLFLVLPMFTSLVGMVFMYGKQKFSWWLAPILVYSIVPVPFVVAVCLHTAMLPQVQEGFREASTFGPGNFLVAIVVSSAILFLIFIGTPIVSATLVWAKKDWKKLVAIPVVSFVVLTVTFFLLLIDRA